MSTQITTTLSTPKLKYKPSGDPVSFEVVVQNNSSEFATFQLELAASGVESRLNTWYRLAPDVSAKIPGGDRTTFTVTIIDVPPVPGGFAGTMTLTVRVFSLELRDEDRQVVSLQVEGTGVLPPRLELPSRKFQGYPGDLIEMPVTLYNLNRQSANVSLRIFGLERSWLVDGGERRVQIPPNGQAEVILLCQLPEPTLAPSQLYKFTVEAQQPQAAPVRMEAVLTVLPLGYVEFRCQPPQQAIPAQRGWWKNRKVNSATYALAFDNQSNLLQQVQVEVQRQDVPIQNLMLAGGDRTKAQSQLQGRFEVTPEQTDLPVGETQSLQLLVRQSRPYFGWSRRLAFQVRAVLSDARLDVRNDTQILKLRVKPIIPFILQLFFLILLFLALWIPFLLNSGHQAPVNAVQFNGLATEVISASDDETVRRWRVTGDRLKPLGIINRADKAIRVVRYRPVNNDAIADGFENGQIQVSNLLTKKLQSAFFNEKDDRVFDLRFTQDSRTLYSGHGSGLVLQWDLTGESFEKQTDVQSFQRQKQLDFAVNSMALVGDTEQQLAIAGRYNRLVLWNLKEDRIEPLPYKSGSKDEYILSLSTAEQKPEILAIADNQGKISLWNLRRCLAQEGACERIDEWTTGHKGKPVQSVALSPDACYLASAGEDGRIMLWTLNGRTGQVLDGKPLAQSRQPMNSVDLIRVDRKVLVVSGGDNHRVKLYEAEDINPSCS
ncbi:MAG: WD40 repeat domain-containing protein [Oculatellaceae cyanobacterium Prado106]|jgi:WD40 repeat protein|nr:WD40 repeat domain-containing protein [Oculatellaceae cyanobacterium Prado106]